MYIAGRWADRQLSRLELVVAVTILSVIVFILMQQMLKIFAQAERSLMTNTVLNINTAMQYKVAEHVLRGEYSIFDEVRGSNPIMLASHTADWLENYTPDWLDDKGSRNSMLAEAIIATMTTGVPGNYIGELEDPDPASINGGQWYFNTVDRTLMYRVDNTEYFYTDLTGPARVKFNIEIDYDDRNKDNQFDPAVEEYRKIRLKPDNEYSWEF